MPHGAGGMTAKSEISSFRVVDTSLTATKPVNMNGRPKLGSERGGLNVRFWVGGSLRLRTKTTH